jgi:hypothetical protein
MLDFKGEQSDMITPQEANELRLYANDIIRKLTEAGEVRQIALLQIHAEAALTKLGTNAKDALK